MSTHWCEAEDAADEAGKFAIGFKVTSDPGARPLAFKLVRAL